MKLMINLKILVPDSTTNYVTNPNFRNNTTGWTTAGSTLTRVLTKARFSIASGQVVTPGSVLNEGVYVRLTSLSGINQPCTGSIYVLGSGKVRARLRDGGGTSWVSDTVSLSPTQWTRLSASGFLTGTNDVRLYVETAEDVARAITFYVDGAQIELKPYATTYCDGDQSGCLWAGAVAGSTSSRSGGTRHGGRWVPLAGPCRGENDIYATQLTGFGMAPITNITQEWSQEAGGFYQSTRINSRPVIINFYIKNEVQRMEPIPNTVALHALRQQLIDLFKPDLTLGGEAFLFEYSEEDGDRPLYIWMRYEAGLTGSWDVRNAFVNSMPVRMLAVDPAFYEDNQDVKQLDMKGYFNNSVYKPFWKKGLDGKWTAPITFTSNKSITNITRGSDGTLYLSVSGTEIHKWDGVTLTKIATLNAPANVLEFGFDGILYIGGAFTTVDGVAMNYIAKYDPSTGTWSALSTGANASVTALCFAPNGQLYVGGGFSSLGGVTCRYIGRWDGTQFGTVGATSGVSDVVRDIKRGLDNNTLVVGGDFNTSYGGGTTYNKVCAIDTTTNLISPLGVGFSNSGVIAMVQGLDGVIYAIATSVSAVDGLVFAYSGGTWTNILTIIKKYPTGLRIGPDGTLYVCGNFEETSAGYFPDIARYIRGSWTGFEANFNVSSVYDMLISEDGEIVVITTANLSGAFTAAYNTVVNNGSMSTFPIMYFKGPATIRYIENTQTRQAIYLDMPIYENEEVTFDFARGAITSTIRGSMLYGLLPGSEIRGIHLLPGDNEIAVLVDNEVDPVCQLRWTPKHWSADAIEIVSQS